MNVQATATGNQQVAPRESIKLSEQQGDAGSFDAAVASLLAVLNTGREQTFQQTFDVAAGRNANAKDSVPVADKASSQAEELSRRVMKMATEAAARESGVSEAGNGEDEEPEDTDIVRGRGGSHHNVGMNNQMGQIMAEAIIAEEPVGLTPPVAAEDTAPKVVIQTEEPLVKAQPQTNPHQNVNNRMDLLLGHLLVKNAEPEAPPVQVQAVVAEDEAAEAVNVKADNTNQNPRIVVDLEQQASVKQETNPTSEPVKAVNAGNAPNLEKAAAAANTGENQGKVAPEVVAKVVINETQPQQQPQTGQQQQQQTQEEQVPDATRGQRENQLFQFRQVDPMAAEAGKTNPTVAEKVDPANVFITGNANQTGGQQAAAADEPVTLEGLRDRMVQEVRFLYQSMGNGKQQAQVQLKLHPANLGELTVRLFFQKGGEVTAHFYAATNNVKEVLESSMQQLRTALHAHDLKLNDTQVFLNDYNQKQHENPNFNTEGRNGGGNVASRYNANRPDGDEPEAAAARPMREVDESDEYQVNYYV